MDSKKKILACVVSYNTDLCTKLLLERFPRSNNFDVLIVNDGSTDNTASYIRTSGFKSITHPKNRGLGAAIKSGINYALENGYYAIVILAGNNKDNPSQINKVLKPILEEDYDYVQGSRFLKGGSWDNLPLFRYIMIKVHVFFIFLFTGFRGTDALNGFRAYKLSVFKDSRINPWQIWLDKYEFEPYLHYKMLTLNYKVKEIPVSKVYPKGQKKKYSHIRPIVDWWKIISPILILKLKIKN